MTSIQGFFERAESYYSESLSLKSVKEAKAAAGLAAKDYWCAFVLGHPQAALPLALCFTEGHGVRKDTHTGKLFFGIAKILDERSCANYTDVISVPKSMDDEVIHLWETFSKTQSMFADQMRSNVEIDMSIIDKQFNHFSNYFVVDHGTVVDYFINHPTNEPSETVPLSGADSDSGCCGGCVLF